MSLPPFKITKYANYGDEWLQLHDIMNKMTIEEVFMMEYALHLGLLPINELAYLTGAKQDLMRHIAMISGINRVIKSDPKKYRKLLQERGILKTLDDFEPKLKEASYFQ